MYPAGPLVNGPGYFLLAGACWRFHLDGAVMADVNAHLASLLGLNRGPGQI